MWNNNENINKDKTMNDYEGSLPDKSIKNLKDVLGAYNYHNDANVRRILLNQRDRVGRMFGRVEQAMAGMAFVKGKVTYAPYKPQGLEKKWNDWSHDRLVRAGKRADKHLDTWLPSLKARYTSDDSRQAATFAKATGDDGPQKLIDKIDALAAAIEGRPAWDPAF